MYMAGITSDLAKKYRWSLGGLRRIFAATLLFHTVNPPTFIFVLIYQIIIARWTRKMKKHEKEQSMSKKSISDMQ